ncbi:MAG: winged helix-turn-helix transcriptional regulator, partial [Candidatus Thorarchaeota archaeon]
MILNTSTSTRYPGVTALKLTFPLDKTDVEILTALQEARKKVTTTHLSEQLKLPERTIRYRLNKLHEKGLLKPPKIQTYERKLGLGERLLLLQAVPEMEDKLVQVLEVKSLFYFYGRTYGKYDGFVAHTMYPLVAPQIVLQLAEEMKDLNLVEDFYIFDLVDYCRKGVDVKPVLKDSPWTWNVWTAETRQILKKGCELDLGLEQFPKVVNFD